jgi:hypothetical protein
MATAENLPLTSGSFPAAKTRCAVSSKARCATRMAACWVRNVATGEHRPEQALTPAWSVVGFSDSIDLRRIGHYPFDEALYQSVADCAGEQSSARFV